ncbi:hypothetical protein GCM10009733_029160 [Nonomuraea maheshkhaliensis]|uniref:Uncharacterized protein n=1 Tax=Nonomuraea maheshkhaliensis TaxID=419590 RepID=A0ABN2F6X6_9ACTN
MRKIVEVLSPATCAAAAIDIPLAARSERSLAATTLNCIRLSQPSVTKLSVCTWSLARE